MSMGYVSSQDAAIAREAAAKAEADAAQAERRAEYAASREVGRGLFKDTRLHHLDELVRVELNKQQGHVRPHELAAAQARVREALQPILTESPEMPLDAFKEIVAGLNRPKLDDAGVDARAEMLVNARTAVYETRSDRKATLAAVNAELATEKPLLNALLKSTGAGNSVPLARMLIEDAMDRTHAQHREASAAKPFRALPDPVTSASGMPRWKTTAELEADLKR
jgi:hypothetical protein